MAMLSEIDYGTPARSSTTAVTLQIDGVERQGAQAGATSLDGRTAKAGQPAARHIDV